MLYVLYSRYKNAIVCGKAFWNAISDELILPPRYVAFHQRRLIQ